MGRKKKYKHIPYTPEPEMVQLIRNRTGVNKEKVKRILRAFNLSFFNYMSGDMKKPLRILGVFTIYLKTEKQKKKRARQKKFRESVRDLKYRK